MKTNKKAIYIGQDTSDIQNGEELQHIGMNYDDISHPSYVFRSIENGTVFDLYEHEIEWIKKEAGKS